jgi:tRNA pseudouridine38-40 synthase
LINYKVTFSYFGKDYCGFQFQPRQLTVEAKILDALAEIFKKRIKITVAGRTDTGVHAAGQVFNFRVTQEIAEENLLLGLNSHLPKDIRIKKIEKTDFGFNARRSALSREYQYLFYYNDIFPYYLDQVAVRIKFKPDESLFAKISEELLGKHDFVNFRKLGSNEASTYRTIDKFELTKVRFNDIFDNNTSYLLYKVIVRADSFVYGMVRNLVGAIWQVLKNKRTLSEFNALLNNENKFSYSMAPAKGLTLVKVNY